MNRFARLLAAISMAGASLIFVDAAGAEPARTKPRTAKVTWQKGNAKEVRASAPSSGLKVARDPQTGELRAPTATELPATGGSSTQVVTTKDGTWLVVGDDLMSDVVATKRADGSVKIDCGQ